MQARHGVAVRETAIADAARSNMHLGELGAQFADLREDGQRGARRETGARGGERRHLELLPRVRAQVLQQ